MLHNIISRHLTPVHHHLRPLGFVILEGTARSNRKSVFRPPSQRGSLLRLSSGYSEYHFISQQLELVERRSQRCIHFCFNNIQKPSLVAKLASRNQPTLRPAAKGLSATRRRMSRDH